MSERVPCCGKGNNDRILFKFAASFPCGKSPNQTGGGCDPATNCGKVNLKVSS
jgi:hypothetical protein